MPTIIDYALLHLPALGLTFSMAEFGMTVFNLGQADITLPGQFAYQNYPQSDWVYIHAPWQYVYLVFASSWTMVICTILLITQLLFRDKSVSHNKMVSVVTLAFNMVTTILWVIGVGAIARFYGPGTTGLYATVETFAVLSGVVFVLLTGLNICTAYGSYESIRYGYGPIRRAGGHILLDDGDERSTATNTSPAQSERASATS